jgi:hypothetical protein
MTTISQGRRVAAALLISLATMTAVLAGKPAHAVDPDGSVLLVNYGSGKCLEIVADEIGNYFGNGNRIWQRTCDGHPAQRWYVELVRTDGRLAYHLRNKYTHKCMDVRDGNSADRAVIQQWECHPDATSMAWVPGSGMGEFLQFWSYRTDKCIDIAEGSLQDFAYLQQYHCTFPNSAQLFDTA